MNTTHPLVEFSATEFTTPIRVQMIDGQPWFIAQDICENLDLAKVNTAVRGIDDADLMLLQGASGGQTRTMIAVNLRGFMTVLGKSKKPVARKFQTWITSEILPKVFRGESITGESWIDRIDHLVMQGVSLSQAVHAALGAAGVPPQRVAAITRTAGLPDEDFITRDDEAFIGILEQENAKACGGECSYRIHELAELALRHGVFKEILNTRSCPQGHLGNDAEYAFTRRLLRITFIGERLRILNAGSLIFTMRSAPIRYVPEWLRDLHARATAGERAALEHAMALLADPLPDQVMKKLVEESIARRQHLAAPMIQ